MNSNCITRREFVKLVGAGSAALAVGGALPAWAEDRKPNIVVFYMDDLGYADLGCQGIVKDLATPNIDSLAANGVRFTDGYVSAPMCSPSRSGLMTGRYQQRYGHEFNPGPKGQDKDFGLPVDQQTIASRLKAAGYVTGMSGKWHLGKTEDRTPSARGFMEVGGNTTPDPNPKPEGWSQEENETLASRKDAVAFIEKHWNEPFFYYVPFSAPHHPIYASPEVCAKFPNIKDPLRRMFAAVMSEVDDAVGDVLKALRKHNIEENTLIFFISDNGAPDRANASLNTPYSGYKMDLYEGGIHVPYIFQWKGKVPGGKVYNQPVIQLDVAATALAAAGVQTKPGELDGVDLVPYLNGKSGVPHDALYWRTGDRHAVRVGDWKLLKLGDKPDQLFNLAADPGEKHDLAASEPAKLKELQGLYAKWDAQLMKPRWEERAGGD